MSAQTPRAHHHQFSHDALPKLGASGNPKALDILTTPMGQPFLLDIWETVGSELPKTEHQSPDGLLCITRKTPDGRRALVVQMPRPLSPGESWFIGFVTTPEKRKMLFFKQPATLRCFLLENTAQGTELVEWTREGSQSIGASPAANVNAFVEAMGQAAN